MSVITPKDCFHQPQVADLRLIACPGAEELTNLIGKHLVRWASEAGYQTDSFIIESACPRFQSGDAKGLVKESVRGDDIFIVVDPGNYSVTYKLFNYENHLSPDDHFANLEAPHPGRGRQGTPCVCHHAQPVRRPSAPPRVPREPGLRCGSAGAAGHGSQEHHHL